MILYVPRLILCLLSLFIFLISAVVLHIFASVLCWNRRWILFSYLNRFFARSLRVISGTRITIQGKSNIPQTTGHLIISNHLTYLDGVILGSVLPVIYLSKKEIKGWPLINWMSSISGTIFIDRQRKNDSPKYIGDISKKLKSRVNVLLFPEGTSTNGEELRDFQSVFFASPLACKSFVLPVTINYTKINAESITKSNRDKIYWWGQVPFAEHISQLLRLKSIEVTVKIHPVIDVRKFQVSSLGRKELTKHAYQIIRNEYLKTRP